MVLMQRISNFRLVRISLAAGLVIALGFAAGWSRPKNVADEIMPRMGLESGALITINQEQLTKAEMAIEISGQDYVIDYAFHSIRSPQFRLMVQQDNGELVEQDAPPSCTIRGVLRGVEGSRVIGSMTDVGMSAKINFPTGEDYYMEPVNGVINDPDLAGVHVVYSEDEAIAVQGTCGCQTTLAEAEQNESEPLTEAAGLLQECELAVDADFEFFSFFGSTEATLARMELIINIVNDQYESQTSIRHTISSAVVRATANDPYTTTNSSDLLDELQDEYRFGGFDGDLCHLFTGKNLDGSTVGFAFIGVVCSNSSGFALTNV